MANVYHKNLTGTDIHETPQSKVTDLVTDLGTKTTLTLVKADTDIADSLTKKHSNTLDHSNSLDHTQNTDTDLDATFEAALKNTDNHTSGTTNKVYTVTEQSKLSGIEALAEVNNISDVNATDLTDGGGTTLHSHSGGAGDTLITGATGTVASGAAPTTTLQILTADNALVTDTNLVTQLTASTAAAGWWLAEYWILWRSAATGAGINFVISHSGTAANFQATRTDPLASTTALATVGIFDQQPTTAVTGKLPSVWATRTNAGALGPSAGVVAANVNCMTYITALFLVTVSGNILLGAASETTDDVTVMAGTTARYTRLS